MLMTRNARDVTEAELDVLQVLWERGPQTIREVAAILDRRNQDAYYATVKKLLERLDAKGFVGREPRGIAYLYKPVVGRDELVGRRLREVSESLCDGSVTPLLTQLARHERLSKKQQEALIALIDEMAAEEGKRPQPPGGSNEHAPGFRVQQRGCHGGDLCGRLCVQGVDSQSRGASCPLGTRALETPDTADLEPSRSLAPGD